MPKWEQWIDDEFEDDLELVEDYEPFQRIKRKKKIADDEGGTNKRNKRNEKNID
jgi:hypothetical protein